MSSLPRLGRRAFILLLTAATVLAFVTLQARATSTLLVAEVHGFSGPEGMAPAAALLQASDGNFYGTTSRGGDDGEGCVVHECHGTVFKMTRSGQVTMLHTFAYGSAAAPYADGCVPMDGLVEGPDGFLYGTTFGQQGPCPIHYGTIFKISKTGEFHRLYTFCASGPCTGGGGPIGTLVFGPDGALYGATTAPLTGSTIFRITLAGDYTAIASFFNNPIGNPTGGLVLASDGNFYGVTSKAIYRVTPAGSLTTMYLFGTQPNDGTTAYNGMIQATDGNLYGVTAHGPTGTLGTVFAMSLGGSYHKVFDIIPAQVGAFPNTPMQASDGNLYMTTSNTGSANGGGAVFGITTGGTLLGATFMSANTVGIDSNAPLIEGCDGRLYGTTTEYGFLTRTQNSAGTVFAVTVNAGLTSPHPCPVGRRRDFNGDGMADIFWRSGSSGANGLWLMSGFGISGAAGLPSAPPPWQVAGLGDFDDDGQADILWRNPVTGENGLWLMNGTAIKTAAAIPTAAAGWIVAGVADFDGDGRADILWRNPASGDNGMWLMNGFAIAGAAAVPGAGIGWTVAGVGDLDGDGRADILWRNPSTGENGLWLMNGYVIASAQALPSAGPAWQVAALADFDGDTRADILWRNPATAEDGLWLMSGATILAAQALPGAGPGWIVAEADDFNGDGRADIFWRKPQTGENGLWLMNGFMIQSAQSMPSAAVGWDVQ